MSQLLNTIETELSALEESASSSLSKLVDSNDAFLASLRQIEAQLQAEIDTLDHEASTPDTPQQTGIIQRSEEIAVRELGESLTSRRHSLATTDHEFVDTDINEGRVTPLAPISESKRALKVSSKSTSLEDQTPLHLQLEAATSSWYKYSIDGLKKFNTQVTRFQKNVVSKLNINLDDAYTFPLSLPSYPVSKQKEGTDTVSRIQLSNQDQLSKSIILHLLKIGQGNIAEELLKEYSMDASISPDILNDFKRLSVIVHDIETRHDLTTVLEWLESGHRKKDAEYDKLSFKFHMLQFALLLNQGSAKAIDQTIFDAYTYAKHNFPAYFQEFLTELSPIITCLLFTPRDDAQSNPYLTSLRQMTVENYISSCEQSKRNTKETRFVTQLLENLHMVNDSHFLFDTLAHEFVTKFCSDLALSSESSLFQAMLAGYVNLPNFYRYSHLQRKLKRTKIGSDEDSRTVSKKDLPFQIPDKNQFLFNYHPIFICPISKEQLMPLVTVSKVAEQENYKQQTSIFVSKSKILAPMTNPVVVFNHCRHLALKDSVRQLTKGGAEIFKCHYCYKKHKLSEVSEAYFIDL